MVYSDHKYPDPPGDFTQSEAELWHYVWSGTQSPDLFSQPSHCLLLRIWCILYNRLTLLVRDPEANPNTIVNMSAQVFKAANSLRMDNSLMSTRNPFYAGAGATVDKVQQKMDEMYATTIQ